MTIKSVAILRVILHIRFFYFWSAAILPLLLTSASEAHSHLSLSKSIQDHTKPICTTKCDTPIAKLDLETPIAHEFIKGETHCYEVALMAGQYMHAVIDQQGMDLSITICDPAGNQIAEVDRPNGSQGPEGVSLIAETTGSYRFMLRSNTGAAPKGNYQIAIKEVRLPRADDLTRIEAERAITKGERLYSQGKAETIRESIKSYERALTLWQALNERYEQALAFYGLGWSYSDLGSQGMVKFPLPLHRLRWSYEARDNHRNAINCFSQALTIMQELGNRNGEAQAEAGIAWPYLYLGKHDEALQTFSRAFQVYHSLSNASGEARALYGVGWVYALLEEDQKALDNFLQAHLLRQTIKDRKGDAITLASMGRISNRLGRNEEAIHYCNDAIELFREPKDTHGLASTFSTLGWVYSSLGQYEKAQASFNEALRLRNEIKDATGEAVALYGLAKLQSQQGDYSAALKSMEEVLSRIELLRTKGSTQELRTYYFANVQEYYEFYIDLLMHLDQRSPNAGYATMALWANERARSRELLAVLAEAMLDPNQKLDLTVWQPLRPDEIQNLLDENTIILEYALGESRSYLWVVSQSSITPHELPRRAELEGMVRRFCQLMVARNKQVLGETTLKKNRRVAQADNDLKYVASDLSKTLIGSISAQIEKKRLVIIPQGDLHSVPFAALPIRPANGSLSPIPLAVEHEIVNLPSASVLSVLRHESKQRKAAHKTVAIFADPVFSSQDPRILSHSTARGKQPVDALGSTHREVVIEAMPDKENRSEVLSDKNLNRLASTRWEAQQIASLLPSGESLLIFDFAANREQALSAEMEQYRILHFATHALGDETNPDRSRIVLSQVDEQGRPQIGSLTLRDVYRMKLSADLVVLSACNTGLGKEIKGEGLVGLTRGFMQVGVPRVVASLWTVNSKVTAELMVRFYKKMLGPEKLSPSAALRAAQVEMLKDSRWQHPFFWAAFVVQGEWRPIEKE